MNDYPSAARDLAEGIRRLDIWLGLAWLDLKLRYRRTLVGPFWLPLSSVATIAIMGFVYARLLHVPLADYFPYLAAGLALWTLISSFINDATSVFISAAHVAHQTPLPFSLYVLRRVANALIQFAHTSVSFWAVAICFRVPFGVNTLMFVPGLLMLSVFGFWITLALGTVCLRYRDLAQVIAVGHADPVSDYAHFLVRSRRLPTIRGWQRATRSITCSKSAAPPCWAMRSRGKVGPR